jgi:F-type H+-transporting ATPase subunit a
MHPDLWITNWFNHYAAGLGNTLRGLVGLEPDLHPWADFVTLQLVVVAIIVVLFAALRPRLSPDRPGAFQHIFEIVHNFLYGESKDQVGRHGPDYLAYFGTVFFFIAVCNLIGSLPGFLPPTMNAQVPLGVAVATFGYYNLMGMRAVGVGSYLKHFAGPMPLLAPLMIPIEVISHLARPLSLTIRLFANMYAGEQVLMVFLALTYLVIPAAFMSLHIFVALLQAYIFTLLTMMYVAGAVAHDH